MKKYMIILFAVMTFTACTQFISETPTETVSNETFSKVALFNPNSTKVVKLISVVDKTSRSTNAADEKEVCEIEPLQTKEIELGSEHEYYFTDDKGNKIANLEKSKDGQYLPVYLELNEPKYGKEYLLLNQYKTDNILESYTRYRNDGTTYETYNLLLYEVVNADDLDAYRYSADTYIRTYPSTNYWIDSKGYVSNKIGKKLDLIQTLRIIWNHFQTLG